MKKQFWLVTLFTVLSGLGITANASTKIGVVDLGKVMAEAKETKTIKAKLEAKFEPRKNELMAFQDKIKGDIEKLQRDDAVMTDSQKKSLQQKIMSDRKSFEQKGQAYQQELNSAQNKAMQKFFEKVKKVVDDIASSEKYDIILQKEGVPFASSSMDITKQVASKL